jgi:hypothetical protein
VDWEPLRGRTQWNTFARVRRLVLSALRARRRPSFQFQTAARRTRYARASRSAVGSVGIASCTRNGPSGVSYRLSPLPARDAHLRTCPVVQFEAR